MAGVPVELEWTPEEEADALAMDWLAFDAKYQGRRSYHGWRVRRGDLRRGRRRVTRAPNPAVTVRPEPATAATLSELWEISETLQEVADRQDRKLPDEIMVRVETDRPFGIIWSSDWHIGARIDYAGLRRWLEMATSCQHLRLFVGGDPVDNYIVPGLASVARDDQAMPPAAQWELFRAIVNDLVERQMILGVGSGNHDGWTRKLAGIDGVTAALSGIPTVYTGEGGFIDLTVGQQRYCIFRKHRPGGFNSRLNDTHSAKQALRFGRLSPTHGMVPDVVVLEHQHQPAIEMAQVLGHERIFVRTGSWKVRDAWAREWGFVHSAVGTPVTVFDPHRRRIVPFSRLEDAIEFVER